MHKQQKTSRDNCCWNAMQVLCYLLQNVHMWDVHYDKYHHHSCFLCKMLSSSMQVTCRNTCYILSDLSSCTHILRHNDRPGTPVKFIWGRQTAKCLHPSVQHLTSTSRIPTIEEMITFNVFTPPASHTGTQTFYITVVTNDPFSNKDVGILFSFCSLSV